MIYTVTFNPSLDYIVSVPDFTLGLTNRTSHEMILPGGKGINVSMVLKNLGVDNTALGFIAGFTGEKIRQELEKLGIKNAFIQLDDGFTRINVKLASTEGTEINGIGPTISKSHQEKLLQQLDTLKKGDALILAGSIPQSLDDDIYSNILERLKEKDITIVVDATKELLVKVLKYHPFLVKPNVFELGEIFDTEIKTKAEIAHYAKELQKLGARNVLVSMAGDGALLLEETGAILTAKAPEGTLVNSVGSGDSMVAGFLSGWFKKKDLRHAFSMGVAAGSASAFSQYLATEEEILAMNEIVKGKVEEGYENSRLN